MLTERKKVKIEQQEEDVYLYKAKTKDEVRDIIKNCEMRDIIVSDLYNLEDIITEEVEENTTKEGYFAGAIFYKIGGSQSDFCTISNVKSKWRFTYEQIEKDPLWVKIYEEE